MKIHTIEFKNFASYGNRVQRIDFEDIGNLYLVLGSNGAGKSSLAKVITYLCYGKTEGANIKDLPNRVNGTLWGRITMTCKNNEVTVERGISPGIFNVSVNGVEYDVAGKNNLQEFLETEIYDIPYHVFKNVIILSVNDFKSFITMSPSDKKQIVDRIFGFSAINDMKELVKNKRKLIAEDIRVFEEEIKTLTDSIESVKNKLDEFEKASANKNSAEIRLLKERLLKLNEDKKKLVTANEQVKTKIVSTTAIAKEKAKEQQDAIYSLSAHNRALKLYENNSCPTCGGSLESEFHEAEKEKHKCAIEELKDRKVILKTEVEDSEDSLRVARETNRKIIARASQLDTQMEQIKEELIKISKSKGQDSVHLHDLIEDFDVKKDASQSSKSTIEGKNYYLSLLETIVGEDGIKNLAVKSILPSLNNHVMLMGKEMGIPFGIVFDEKFNCVLYHLGEEISPKTLSTGEKKKADFVIIMALIKMIKTRFPGLNILFLDEIFSSIDSDGIYHIINILHQTIKEAKINTFVINHTVLPSEYFDKRLEISKDSGFSEFTIEDIG
jgi:DNA repair exonuclease SbcCD ATPase subunit